MRTGRRFSSDSAFFLVFSSAIETLQRGDEGAKEKTVEAKGSKGEENHREDSFARTATLAPGGPGRKDLLVPPTTGKNEEEQREVEGYKLKRLTLRDSPGCEIAVNEIKVLEVTHPRGNLRRHVDEAVEAVSKSSGH